MTELPTIVAALIEHDMDATIVARAENGLPVVLANEAARFRASHAEVGDPLESWIGDEAVEIARDLDAGHPAASVKHGRWTLATDAGERWIVYKAGPAIGSRLPGEAALATEIDIDDVDGPAVISAYEAALAVATEVELGAVLQRIVDLARTVVPSKYAALGVSNAQGRIEQFITSGLTLEERAAIGPIPEGHGMLGELIRERTPLLVPDIAADSRSVGFPPNHPPMRTLLGTPILLRERVLGNLYLTERLGQPAYDQEDLAAVQVLAAHAATAIERAELYRQVEVARERAVVQLDQIRVILDSLPTGVAIFGASGAVELMNDAAIEMIFGRHALPGVLPTYGRDFQLVQPDGVPILAAERPINRALRGEEVRNRQLLLEGADGSRMPILVQAAPLRNATGSIDRAVVVFQDVTRLREAEQLKDDFLSLISHEVRTPLTAIHGGAYMLANQGLELDEETRRELLEDIVIESGRLDRMLANLLNLTAIMAGRFVANTEPVLFGPLARQQATEVAARSPGHSFQVDIPVNLPPAECDPALMGQVLRNLYENAVKYSPPGGVITTTAESDGSSVTISVTDQGYGIAPDQIGRVFERFHRASTNTTVRGMGLGLYISRSLVEAQGGRIQASSPGLGAGSTFSVTMPIAREE